MLAKCLSRPTQNTHTSFNSANGDRHAIFVGDSNVRQLYFAALRQVDGGKNFPKAWETDSEKHSDRTAVIEGKDGGRVTLDFWW